MLGPPPLCIIGLESDVDGAGDLRDEWVVEGFHW